MSISIPYVVFSFNIVLLFFINNTKEFNKECVYSIKLFSYFSLFFEIVLFLGMRGLIGTDWEYYYPYYVNCPSLFDLKNSFVSYSKITSWGLGYCFLNSICKTLRLDYYGFQFIMILIDYFLLDSIFRKYCGKYYLLAWFFFYAFNGLDLEILYLRNVKSILIFLYSLKYVEQRRCFKYMTMNMLGYLFHSSSIFYLPIYFLFLIKRHKKFEMCIFLIGIIFFMLKISWVKVCLNFLSPILPAQFQILIKAYSLSSIMSGAYSFSLGFLERLFTYIILYLYIDKIIDKNKNLNNFWVIFKIFIYLYLYCSDFGIIIARVTVLFIPAYWILLANLYYNLDNRERKLLFLCMYVLYGLFKIFIAMNVKWATYENVIIGVNSIEQRRLLIY